MTHLLLLRSSATTQPPPPPHRRRHRTTTTKLTASPSVHSRPPPPPLHSSNNKIHLKYYTHLASTLASDSKFQDFIMVVENVIASGVEPSKIAALLNVGCLGSGIGRGLRAGKVQEVVGFLRDVERLLGVGVGVGVEVVREECVRLVECGVVEEAVELMECLVDLKFSIKQLMEPSRLISVCVEKHDPSTAIRYACIHPHVHVLFCTIISEFGKKGDLASAYTVFEASKQKLSGPNMYVYRTIIDVCGLCGDYMNSRSIYGELLGQKVTPNVYVFNSLMNVNACDLSYTLHVFQNMRSLGVAADMTSYNILLKACCLAGQVDLAQEIYKEVLCMQLTGVLKMDIFTYSTIIKVFADAKLWQMALKVKDDMLSAGVTPNTVAWSSLISAHANSGLVEKAIQLFEEMIQAGSEPNPHCYNTILHACVEACQYDRAFRLFQQWKGNYLRQSSSGDCNSEKEKITSDQMQKHSSTATSIHYSNTQHFPLAKRFSFMPTTTTYNILMKACGSDYHRAKALMDEMKAAGLSPNYISWSTLMSICGSSGDVDSALRILKRMHGAGMKPDVVSYTTAIKVCVETKSLMQAFSLFEEMKRFHIRPNMVTYNTLLKARSRYGSLIEVQQCLAIYQDMRKAGYKPNDNYLKELIEEWCEGVIQDDNDDQATTPNNISDTGRPQSVLLEKVAAHLQKNMTETLSIDLQGLTKVEARLIILAVLRMVKENYTRGLLVQDDITIVLGFNEVGAKAGKHETEIKDAVVGLLQDSLGLEVHAVIPKVSSSRNTDPSYMSLEGNLRRESQAFVESSTRRPGILQRLKITRKSLQHWVRRRVRVDKK